MAHLRQPRPTARRTRRSAAKRPIRQLRGGPQIQPAANHSRLGPDLDSAGSREARGYRAGRAAADRQHSFLQRRMLVRHVININAFAGCVLMVGVLAPGLEGRTYAVRREKPRGQEPGLHQRLLDLRSAMERVYATADDKAGRQVMEHGLKKLIEGASPGASPHPAEAAFLHLVNEALSRAVAPHQDDRRLFHSLDFAAQDRSGTCVPYFTFADAPRNGGSARRRSAHSNTWDLSFPGRGPEADAAELLFPLRIEAGGERQRHYRTQLVKVRRSFGGGESSSPPALEIVSPTAIPALAAVKEALLHEFGVAFE